MSETDDELRALYEGTPDGVLIADAQSGQFLRANPAICQMLGYSEEELLRLSVPDIHPTDEMPRVQTSFAEMREGTASRIESIRCLRKDGSIFCADISAIHLSCRGRPALAGFFRDVTEQVRDRELLRIQRDLGIALGSVDDVRAAADLVLRCAMQIEGIDSGGMYVVDPSSRGVTLVAHCGLSDAYVAAVSHYAVDAYPARVVAAGQPIYGFHPDALPELLALFQSEGIKAVSVIPVLHEGQAIASLNVASHTETCISLSAHHALEAIAARIGSVLARLRAEKSLRESEEKFRSFVVHSAYAYAEVDLEGRVQYATDRAARLFGASPEEVYGRHYSTFLEPSDRARATENVDRILKGRNDAPREYQARVEDGSTRFVQVYSLPLMKEGKAAGLQCTFLDVTAQRLAERAVRQSEAEFRSLFENLPDFVLVVDQDLTIRFANRDGNAIPRAKLIGLNGLESLIPEHRLACQEAVRQAVDFRQVQALEVCDIFGHWWASRIVPLVEDEQVRRLLVICTDITEQRRHTEAIQKEQRLLRRILDLHERDRQLMAYELHDGLTQQITAALLGFQAARELHGKDPKRSDVNFETGLRLLGQSVAEARRLINGLRPPILDELGIVAAIEFLVCECRGKDGPELEFDPEVDFRRLAPPLESAIFRIIQESLNNAVRHSQSLRVRIELVQKEDSIHISVRDWGIGFDPESVREGRFGLQSIRERARLLGGKVVIATAAGEGTEVMVELPVIERPSVEAQ